MFYFIDISFDLNKKAQENVFVNIVLLKKNCMLVRIGQRYRGALKVYFNKNNVYRPVCMSSFPEKTKIRVGGASE